MDRLGEVRKDVDSAISVWRKLIAERLGERIEYATIKGSATKEWDSLVDYIPMVSDLDIHIKTKINQSLFPKSRSGFIYSIETTRLYEEEFLKRRPNSIHIPRPQIVLVDPEHEEWLPETPDEIMVLYGEAEFKQVESEEDCRRRDLAALLELKARLDKMPERVIDRIGLEYFRIIRELCYVVSPTPVRVLSQFTDSKAAWKYNRTMVIKELDKLELNELSGSYKDYYLKGWSSFEKGFNDNQVMRELIILAYDVLSLSYEIALKV